MLSVQKTIMVVIARRRDGRVVRGYIQAHNTTKDFPADLERTDRARRPRFPAHTSQERPGQSIGQTCATRTVVYVSYNTTTAKRHSISRKDHYEEETRHDRD